MEQLSNEKVKIASQSYEMIDNCVVQLDKLYAKITQQSKFLESCRRLKRSEIKKLKVTDRADAKKNRRRTEITPIETEVKLEKFDPTCYVDMPVDPNEPIYCFCHQASI